MPHKTIQNQRSQMVKSYLTEDKSVQDIAAENNLSLSTVRYWLHVRRKFEHALDNDQATEGIAMYNSFFATCRLHDLNPEKWLTYALQRITDAKPSEYVKLLPSNIGPELLK